MPPSETTMCRKCASRPTVAKWLARWMASASHSCTETSVSLAPSPTMISTFSLSRAEPVFWRTTVETELGLASMRVCAARAPLPSAERATVTSTCSSPEIVTASALSNELQALAEAFSSGVPVEPMRASVRSTHETSTPATASAENSYVEPSSGSVMSGSTCFRGVSFHSASKPVTSGKSAGSVEVKRSERVWTGTRAHPPSLWALLPCSTVDSGLAVSAAGAGVMTSRRCLPCSSR